MHYRPEIDGLRAVAVIPVIFYHAGFGLFSGGYIGVDVFFVVSGYLITSIILTEIKDGTFSVINFYERRARRILPALYFMIFISSVFAWFVLLAGEFQDFAKSLIAVPAFISNIFFWRDAGYFDVASELKPLLHTWSLAVEEQFYVLYPIFLLFIWRLATRWIIFILLAISCLSLGLAEWASEYHPSAGFYLLPTRMWELLAGACAAFYLAKETPGKGDGKNNLILSTGGLSLITVAVFFLDANTPWPSSYTLLPITGTVLVILFASKKNAIGFLLSNNLFVFLGLISYSAYLWHHPIFVFSRFMKIDESNIFSLFFMIALTFIIAYLSWKFVEQPFRKKHFLSRRIVFLYSLCVGIGLILFGIAGVQTSGFVNRFSKADRYLASINITACGEYVNARFNTLQLASFNQEDRRLKVVLIGDSYAQDLVNAVYESELKKSVQLSTYHISARHGNLYLDEDVSKFIAQNDLATYLRAKGFDNPDLKLRMRDSDMIWLASAWRDWQTKFIPASLENLEREFGEKVFIFGSKNFGDIDLRKLLSMSVEERQKHTNSLAPQHVKINEFMNKTLPNGKFIDISFLLCGNKSECKLFTESGHLISYDGGHLTREGSRYFGKRLVDHFLDNAFLSK